jgi:hypothetical protein
MEVAILRGFVWLSSWGLGVPPAPAVVEVELEAVEILALETESGWSAAGECSADCE